MSGDESCKLGSEELTQFRDQGYSGPHVLCSPDEMALVREQIDRVVFTSQGAIEGHFAYARHLDSPIVFDLCSHPAIVQRIGSLYGPDLVLWNSSFWIKNPGDPAIPWHQDIHYWRMEPPVNVTAWLAITEVKASNACVRILPESNRSIVPHVPAKGEFIWEQMADPARVDETKAIDMELRPGEFFIFNDRLMHSSRANRSSERRIGLGARFTLPFVKLYQDEVPLFPGHRAIVVSGEDRMGFNKVGPPPPR